MAMAEVPKPGHPPCCLHRVAQTLLAMDDPLARAREYAAQALTHEDPVATQAVAHAILRYGHMERPSWEIALDGVEGRGPGT